MAIKMMATVIRPMLKAEPLTAQQGGLGAAWHHSRKVQVKKQNKQWGQKHKKLTKSNKTRIKNTSSLLPADN